MKRSITFFCLIVPIVLSSCTGMRVWEKNRHFQTHVADDFEKKEIKTIGIYVYSDGKATDAVEKGVYPLEYLNGIMSGAFLFFPLPFMNYPMMKSPATDAYGLKQENFCKAVTLSSTFEPDTSNSGPSLELAQTIKIELESRGYIVKAITDLGHNREVSTKECIENAKKAGLDAAFVVHYSGFNKWAKFGSIENPAYKVTQINIIYSEGFLYLPNATVFDTKTSEELWGNSYYGLVQHAHTFNLSSQPFNIAVNEALFEMGDETYMKAAPKAAKIIFDPTYWRGSFKEFPVRTDRKKKL